MIIDSHCHAGKGDLMTAPWNTDAPLAAYLRRARAAGIDKTIVMAAFHTDNLQANRQVARLVARHPTRLIGFAFVNAKRDAGRIFRMVKHAVTHWGFRGIKVHGYEAMPNREICDTAEPRRCPLWLTSPAALKSWTFCAAVSAGELHRRAPRKLHRQLEGPSAGHLSTRALPKVTSHLRSAAVRLPGGNGAGCGSAQTAVRIGWAVADPGFNCIRFGYWD